MSMLAEKKRRVKWSLNPRGKAWSEDQNKFGQRLMEKMGWKAGQGLGVDSQGQTDIVKARVKNDSKGLGFKENGEEWLKTTSDFDNLLDELAGSQEGGGDGSKTETLASLEDRSKKSRARVHYHKFTRGKDISRYSEKDLASIIGPEVIKLKNGQESKSDYTQNQVNRGSLEEYFSKKSKSKDAKSGINIVNSDISGDFKETEMNSTSEFGGLSENSGDNLKIDLESEVSSKKKKRKKTTDDENVAQVKNNTVSGNCEFEDSQNHLETEVLGKKKKKRKSGCNVENSLQELEETDPHSLNSVTSGSSKKGESNQNNKEIDEHEPPKESSDVCQTYDTTSKKRKRKEDLSQDVENSDHLDNTISQIESNTDKKTQKKKKRKIKGEETLQSEYNENHTNYNSVIAETAVNEEIVLKKKKKKSRDENNEYQEDPVNVQVDCNEDCSASNLVVSEETVINNDISSKKKKKKSKDKNKEHLDDPAEVKTEYNEMCTNNIPVVAEENIVNNDLASKKKKKTRDENKEHKEEPLGDEQTVMKKKSKKGKENSGLDGESIGTSETTPQCEQVVPHNNSGDFLKVLGRRTRLKNIKTISKTVADDLYKTEDFMTFCKTDNSKKEAAEGEDTLPINTEDEDKRFVYIYRESNPLDSRISRDVLSYENKLVTNKLSKLEMIKKPCIVITDSQNLTKSAVKKLEEVHRVRYYKEFLSERDISEINAAMNKFRESHINSEAATSKDVNQNSVVTKPKPVQKKVEKKSALKNASASPNNLKTATGKCANNNSKLATSKEASKSVNNEKANYFKCCAEANTDDCNVPKHVAAYEYRLVTSRLKHLDITQPEVKVVIKESNTLNESTRRKLKQIEKTRHLKTLLPPTDLTEVEALVTDFYNSLKPKIEAMNTISELEEQILKIARNLDGKPEVKLNEEEDVKVKGSLSKKVEAMTDLFQKLETLLESFRKTKDESSTSEDKVKENCDAEDAGEQSESRGSWLKKVEDKLDTLKKHMKMLAEGKKPPDLNIIRESQTTSKNNTEKSQKFNTYEEKNNYYQSTSYSRGRIAHNVSNQRGRGRGIGRSQSVSKRAVPSGGWGILKAYGSGTDPGIAGGSQNCRDGFSDAGRFMGRGRGFSDRGGFMGRGRGFIDRGGFSGRGRGFGGAGGFMGLGRGDFRGRGRGDMRGRGRISQNNFEAKLYAEKCKELNKVPEVCFNGVNMKVISGYPDNVNSSSNHDSTCLGSQSIVSGVIGYKESVAAVNTTQNVPGGFSEVVVRKDVQSVDQDKVPKNRSGKGAMKREGVSGDSIDKKGTVDSKVT